MAEIDVRDMSNFSTKDTGEQSAMIRGILVMLRPSADSLGVGTTQFGEGSGFIFLDDVQC